MTLSSGRRPPLIAVEGIDGAGTTTQARLLADWLAERGTPVHLTCEPSRGVIGKLVRAALGELDGVKVDRRSLALLFAADRLHHLQSEVAAAQANGEWVVTDRYVYSSLAYQSLDTDPAWVAAINQYAPDADLAVYLQVDPQVALSRVAGREGTKEIFETLDQQRRIAARYDCIFGTFRDRPAGETCRSVEICHDPSRSRGIAEDLAPLAGAVAARGPRLAILDGGLNTEAVQHELQTAVQRFALDEGLWKPRETAG